MRPVLAALGIASSLAGPLAAEEGRYGKYESPIYEVQTRVETAEIRLYAPQLRAVVTVEGGQREALSRGFRALAGYIFGGNASGQSIAMTSPVTQTVRDDELSTVTFMVPRAWDTSSLPQPNNSAVRFEPTEARRMIVLQFSGRTPSRVLRARTSELRAIAARAGLSLTGPPEFAFYDDPFTPPWTRRNEVAFLISP